MKQDTVHIMHVLYYCSAQNGSLHVTMKLFRFYRVLVIILGSSLPTNIPSVLLMKQHERSSQLMLWRGCSLLLLATNLIKYQTHPFTQEPRLYRNARYSSIMYFQMGVNEIYFRLNSLTNTDKNIVDKFCQLVKYFLDFPLWEYRIA